MVVPTRSGVTRSTEVRERIAEREGTMKVSL
jgi:hypothetical protein